MRVYQIPPNVNEKEKVIGGVLDLHQFLWLLAGFVSGIIVFITTFLLVGKLALLFGGITALSGLPFVLIKIKGLPLYEFLKRVHLFKKKTKELPNKRVEKYWE